MIRKHFITLMGMAVLILGLSPSPPWPTLPICTCYDNGDGDHLLRGGLFSDGSSAAGVNIYGSSRVTRCCSFWKP